MELVTSPRALVRKTVLFQPLCFLVFSGGFAVVLLRLWHAQLRSTSVSIDQLLTLAVGARCNLHVLNTNHAIDLAYRPGMPLTWGTFIDAVPVR